MGAIFGITRFDERPVELCDLEQMRQKLAHRGLDGGGLWHRNSVGLGHLKLTTTPESRHEALPLVDPRSGLVITADARLDNRDELIDQLQLSHRPQREVTDSALILRAYLRWGKSCAEKLLGEFVFAIWDSKTQTLFCARDPLGVRHFYYYRSERIFAFASEIKALFCLGEIPQTLNESTIGAYLLPFYEEKVETLFAGILRIPAAHILLIECGKAALERYWSPDLKRELRLGSDLDYAEAFRDVFTQAVRCRLRTEHPVGAMLSGGLDSSSIACTAATLLAQEGRGPLHTFSGIFPSLNEIAPKIDERNYALAVVARGGMQDHPVRVDNFSPLHDLSRIFWHQDNSVPAPNIYMDWAIFRAAQEQGVRVLFSGNDGDSIVSFGFEDLSEYVRRFKLIRLAREAAALSKQSRKRYRTFKRLVFEEGLRKGLPDSTKQWWRVLQGRPRFPDQSPALPAYCRNRPINPNFAKRINLTERISELSQASFPDANNSRASHWQGINSGMDCFLLESFEKAAGAFALEIAFPFFDRRVIEFCLSLPLGQKLQRGWTRSILRRGMEGILPPTVQWRRGKADISANLKLNLLEYERETLDEIIIHHPEVIADYVDVPALQRLYRKYQADPLNSGEENFVIALVANLALWLKSYHSGKTDHRSAQIPKETARLQEYDAKQAVGA